MSLANSEDLSEIIKKEMSSEELEYSAVTADVELGHEDNDVVTSGITERLKIHVWHIHRDKRLLAKYFSLIFLKFSLKQPPLVPEIMVQEMQRNLRLNCF